MDDPTPMTPQSSRRDWNAAGVVVATLVGSLALLVSAYTAHIQRQQVSAQVWPYLQVSNYDNEFAIKVLNKGVGPALVRGVRVWVDGQPQTDWRHALGALGVSLHGGQTSTLSGNVLSAGESLTMLRLFDEKAYRNLRAAYPRVGMEICFCSTLDDCWLYSDRGQGRRAQTHATAQCPQLSAADAFQD
jgi:hypothetical protein